MNKFGTIAVGLRLSRYCPEFFCSWTHLLTSGLRDGDRVLQPAVNMPHAIACNYLVKQFLASDCESLFLLDDDHDFVPAALSVLRSTDPALADVAGGLYPTRRGKCYPVCVQFNKDMKPQSVVNPHGIVPVDLMGFGFTLIKRWVIEAVAKAQGTEEFMEWSNKMGEDGLFCHRAKEQGAKLAINADVKVGHVMSMVCNWDAETKQATYGIENFGLASNDTLTAKQGD